MKQTLKTAAEYDLIFGRKAYCYLTKAGVTSSIKRQLRRRRRRELNNESHEV
jgi:hypothetical protein